MTPPKLKYVIEFVADMDRAVKFYRDVLGLTLKFESPDGVSSQRVRRPLRCIRRARKVAPEPTMWGSR